MNTALPLQQYPLRERFWLYAILSALLLASLCLTLAAMHQASGVATGIRNVFGLALVFAATAGAMQMKSLARAGAFLGKQQMPHGLWRAWVRSCVAETSVVCALLCALLCAAVGAMFSARGSVLPWPAGVALVSAALSLGAIAFLHHYSMVGRHIGRLSNSAGCALLLAVAAVGSARVFDSIAAWPSPVLLLMALSWPVLGASLMRGSRGQLAAFRQASTAVRKPMFAPLLSQLRRFSPVDAAGWTLTLGRAGNRYRGTGIGWLVYLGMPIFFYFNDVKPLGWDEAPDARHLISLIAFGLAMGLALLARDLHWRAILMPGGWRHSRIASDIFSTTLKAQYAMIAAIAITSLAYQCLINRVEFGDALRVVANHTLLLAEVPLAIAIALVARALPRSNQVRASMGIVLGVIWLHMKFNIGYANLTRLPAGGMMYAIAMAVLAWSVLALANRMWTPEKLLACARGAGR